MSTHKVVNRQKGDIPGFFNALYNPSAKNGRTPCYSICTNENDPEYGWEDFNRKGDAQAVADWMNATDYQMNDHSDPHEDFESAVGWKGLPDNYLGACGEAANWREYWRA